MTTQDSPEIRTVFVSKQISAQGEVVDRLEDGRIGVRTSKNPEKIVYGRPIENGVKL